MPEKYIFPAIFYYDNDGIAIEFPDLPGALTCGNTTEEAIEMAKECLQLHLYCMERDNEYVPEPSNITTIIPGENGVIVLVEAFMPPIRERESNRTIKKTLTIPYWINAEAEHAGVNFSAILFKGLKDYLNNTNC